MSKRLVSSGQSTRIGEHMIAFGAYRFTAQSYGSDERSIWQFEITHGCRGKPYYTAVMSGQDLREMQRVIAHLAELVETDGNHPKKSDELQAAEDKPA